MATAFEVQVSLESAWKKSDYFKRYVGEEDDNVTWGENFYETLEWLESVDSVETPVGTVFLDDDTERGGEGHGEEIYIIFRLQPNDGGEPQFFRIEGYYASWDGENWDDTDLTEVTREPYEAYRYAAKK